MVLIRFDIVLVEFTGLLLITEVIVFIFFVDNVLFDDLEVIGWNEFELDFMVMILCFVIIGFIIGLNWFFFIKVFFFSVRCILFLENNDLDDCELWLGDFFLGDLLVVCEFFFDIWGILGFGLIMLGFVVVGIVWWVLIFTDFFLSVGVIVDLGDRDKDIFFFFFEDLFNVFENVK